MNKNRRKRVCRVVGIRVRGARSSVLFFPGDLQDVVCEMRPPLWSAAYRKYSYENTLLQLHHKFPESNIFVVYPLQKYGSMSVYSNFYKCDSSGNVKEYDRQGFATQVLARLLHRLNGGNNINVSWLMIGFSRGCCVLNQILSETGYSIFSQYIFQRLKSIIFLDGGAREEAFPRLYLDQINEEFLHKWKSSLEISIHGTPYCWGENDSVTSSISRRPFELLNIQCRNRFVSAMSAAGVKCSVHFYSQEYQSIPGTELDKHMALITYFDPSLKNF